MSHPQTTVTRREDKFDVLDQYNYRVVHEWTFQLREEGVVLVDYTIVTILPGWDNISYRTAYNEFWHKRFLWGILGHGEPSIPREVILEAAMRFAQANLKGGDDD